MPSKLSVTGNESDTLTLMKAGLAATSLIVTLISGVFTQKMMVSRDKKMLLMGSSVAGGVILGTAMMFFMIESDVTFHVLMFRYPMAFFMFCIGYAMAMLVDILLARAVRRLSRESFTNSRSKFLDGIMDELLSDLKTTKYFDTTLPVVTFTPETEDDDGICYLRDLILNQLTQLVHWFSVYTTFSYLSLIGSFCIGEAETKTMAWRAFLNTTIYNSVYVVSMEFTAQRFDLSIPPVVRYLSKCYYIFGPCGVILGWIFTSTALIQFISPSSPGGHYEPDGYVWAWGIFSGVNAGFLVYLAIPYLLRDSDGNDTGLGKFMAVVFGVGVIALLRSWKCEYM